MMRTIDWQNKASWMYGLGVAKIVAGFGIGFMTSLTLLLMLALSPGRGFLYSVSQFFTAALTAGCVLLVYDGFTSCRLSASYKKLIAAVEYKNRERVEFLAAYLKQDLTHFIRDLQRLQRRGFFPGARLDLTRGEWVMRPDSVPDAELKNGDIYYEEDVRPSFKPLIAFPAVLLGYALVKPFSGLADLFIAGVLALGATCFCIVHTRNVTVLKKKKLDLPPPPPPEPIKTGDAAMDEFLNASVAALNDLTALSLAITGEKMLKPVSELLNLTRQIFAFVEKHPEKLRQIRQFMNYYLPTTIKLLQSYRDFSRETYKGENITEAMEKIESSVDGIVETFHAELDSLYLDKAVDISLDIDMMLAMMRQNKIQDNDDNTSEGLV